MSWKFLIVAGGLLALRCAQSAEPAACSTALAPLPDEAALLSSGTSVPGAIEFEAGALEAQFGTRPSAAMTGGVTLRYDDKLAGADSARYDPEQRAVFLDGSVRYADPGTRITSNTAEFAYDLGRIRFEGAEFSLGSNNARGTAEALEINKQGRLELDGVGYTTCPPGSNDWLLEASDIDLDTKKGTGKARGIKLRFQGIPILYAPYLSFPISSARKSGILTPEIGSSDRSGSDIRVPYYWNIAPNYDATITPRLLSDRGMQLQTQFRYLTRNSNGTVDADYLSNDNIVNEARHQFEFHS